LQWLDICYQCYLILTARVLLGTIIAKSIAQTMVLTNANKAYRLYHTEELFLNRAGALLMIINRSV
jgi:hypothetical protein